MYATNDTGSPLMMISAFSSRSTAEAAAAWSSEVNRARSRNFASPPSTASARATAAAAEESSLGERKFLGYDGELVFVDQRAFGEAAQTKALEKGRAVTAQAWGIARSP